jgi:transmembrane sensor
VLAPDSDARFFWENWLQSHPGKQVDITKAKAAILELHLAGLRKEQALIKKTPVLETAPTTEDINAIWENIARSIQEPATQQAEDNTEPATKVIPVFSYYHWAGIAASIIFIIAIGAVYWLQQKPASEAEKITFATAFGETKLLTLPDNSTIRLNANSRLTTAKHWPADADREVTLAGEAFFSVVHTKNHRRFKVTLQKGARVEVLGTEFAVTDRPTLSRVVLNKGKVKVAVLTNQQGASGDNTAIAAIMAPGDLVEIDRLHGKLAKSKIADPEYYSAFTKNLIEFNNSPLSEVARVLQDDYGYKVTFQPAFLANKRFTSSNPSNRIDLLLFAIEKSFNLKVTQKGKHITIKTK